MYASIASTDIFLVHNEGKDMKIITWVVVCDGALAHIFQHVSGQKKLVLKEGGSFQGDKRLNKDINSDREGRCFDSIGGGRHKMEPKHDAHEQLKEHFVTMVLDQVEKDFNEKLFDQLIITCPPRILGKVRKILPASLKKVLVHELDKDLTHSPSEQIFDEVKSYLLPLSGMAIK